MVGETHHDLWHSIPLSSSVFNHETPVGATLAWHTPQENVLVQDKNRF